ncbi:hypothetical protein NNO_0680 [Hydrogenimonas sp.]|nr:hypothetical protein NNO_0680 [Hydrogenimonas sp.]
MTDLLKISMAEVFEQNFGMRLLPCKNLPNRDGYRARIPFLCESGERSIATLWLQRPTLKLVSKILLFEDDPDEESLKDLTSELANFIVGHAKMLASDRNIPCRIETPEFAGVGPLQNGEETILFKTGNRCIALQVKG